MKCLKCGKEAYCSRFCRNHFARYFERKFKSSIRKKGGFAKGESLNIVGENKNLAIFLLKDSPIVRISDNGRKVRTSSLNVLVVRWIASLFNGARHASSFSLFDELTQKEIEHYAELKGIRIGRPRLSRFERVLWQEMSKLELRRPNIWHSSFKMMKFFK